MERRRGMEHSIREATPQDIPALLALEDAFPTDRLGEKDFQHAIASPLVVVFIAEEDRAIAGYCILHIKRTRHALRLYSISVDESRRQSGIGSALLGHAEAWGRTRGFAKLYLEVRLDNEAARRFYMKRDYKRNGHYYNFYADGAKALRFQKPL